MIDTTNDKWIMDLSTNHSDHVKRLSIFNEYLKNKTPCWFIDHKRPDSKYLSIFTLSDISQVSSNNDIFYSQDGYMINDNFKNMPFDGSLLAMDGSFHRNSRSIISSVFTRSRIESLEQMIREVTERNFKEFLSNNSGHSPNAYTHLCMNIPLEINSMMMGVPPKHSKEIMRQTKYIVGNDDPETGNGDPMSWMRACRKLKSFSIELAKEKIKNPSDDITSILLGSGVENESLTEQEFAQFFMLLVVAGMETTTHSLAHGMKLLSINNKEKEKLNDDFHKYIHGACEEILRLEPPVYHFRRTVKSDYYIGKFPVKKGDKIVMWYYTANRDPEKFTDPNKFIIDRQKSFPHTSFGAPGVHHCLGAQLARMEMKIFYEYLFKYMPNFNVDIENTLYSKSRWGNGLKILPITW